MTHHWRHAAALRVGAALTLALCLAPPAGAAGGFRPRIAVQTQVAAGAVVTTLTVNDEPAATFKTTSGGHGPEIRAGLVADRLTALVANGLLPGEISVRRLPAQAWEITARQQSVLLVTPEEAAAHHASPESLARGWAGALRRLLAEAPLALSSPGVTIPYDEARTIRVGGAARTVEIAVQDSDARLTHTAFDPATRLLTIRGLASGRGAVTVQAAGASLSLPVVVMKYAAEVSPSTTVSVTGSPAPSELVLQAIYAGLAKAVNAEPGAQMNLAAMPKVTGALDPGASVSVTLPFRVAGPGLLPVATQTFVTVTNTPVPPLPATALFYSNNPEQLKQGQSLFAGRLQPQKPVRLDYHHQNISGGFLVFHADLINSSDSPAAVQVVSGLALPSQDTIRVGQRAGASFLSALDGNVGLVLDIPPHARVPMVTQRFASGLTVSGIVQMQQIGGVNDALSIAVSADGDLSDLISPVARVILAALPDSRTAYPLPDEPSLGADTSAASPYVFGAPLITPTNTYAVGGKWAYVRIGHIESLKNATGKLTLWGNYGADYHVTLTLTNPTPLPRLVGIFFAPEAGLTSGVFRVDGGPIQQFDPTPPPLEPQIVRYTLAPGETRTVLIETIPLNGSSYPASIIAHAL